MWMLTQTASALGLHGSFLYDTLYSVFFELQQNIKCDLEALQTCSNWRVKMSNGIFVIGFYFVGWYLVLKAFRLEMVIFVSIPFFGIMLLRLCYGYSWTCFPALPACLLEDIYTSIVFFFPKVILIPQTLWLNDIQDLNTSIHKQLHSRYKTADVNSYKRTPHLADTSRIFQFGNKNTRCVSITFSL